MTVSGIRLSAALVCAFALSACSIPPRPDRPPLRDEAPLAGLEFDHHGDWPQAQWWMRYRDAQLTALEEQALAAAPSLAEAQARFAVALRAVDSARAEGGLSSRANAQVQRLRLSEHGLIPPQFLGFTWYNQGDLSLEFQYDFDFWGKTRAAVAAAVDDARAAEAERSAATLLLTCAIADTYFGWQADQAHLALARATVDALTRQRALTAKRIARGIDMPDLMHQADARLAGARELAAAHAGAARVRLAALAGLLGVAPAELPVLQAKPLPEINAALPDDVGLDLLARRPDIAANRWRVEAAMQRVEQARASFYPDISLGALVGLQAIDLDKLLRGDSRMGGIGPALHLPIFGRGQLHAAYGVSQAQMEAAAAQYDASVADAARDVAMQALTLAQIDSRRLQRQHQLDATLASQQAIEARVRRGLGDDRNRLAAQAEVLQQRDAATSLHAQAIATEIALTKALGGGFRVDPDRSDHRDADDPPQPADAASRRTPLPDNNNERADFR